MALKSVALTKRPTSDGRDGHSTLERQTAIRTTNHCKIFEEDEMQNYRVQSSILACRNGIIVKASSEKAVRDRLSNNKTVSRVVRISSMTEDVPQEAKDFRRRAVATAFEADQYETKRRQTMNVDMHARLASFSRSLASTTKATLPAATSPRSVSKPKMASSRSTRTVFRDIEAIAFHAWRWPVNCRDDRGWNDPIPATKSSPTRW